MTTSQIELPFGLNHSVLIAPVALVRVLDAILATQPDTRSAFGNALSQARTRILESLNCASKVNGLSADCQSTLLKIIAGPVADLFLADSKKDPTGLAMKFTNVEVVVTPGLVDERAVASASRSTSA